MYLNESNNLSKSHLSDLALILICTDTIMRILRSEKQLVYSVTGHADQDQINYTSMH